MENENGILSKRIGKVQIQRLESGNKTIRVALTEELLNIGFDPKVDNQVLIICTRDGEILIKPLQRLSKGSDLYVTRTE